MITPLTSGKTKLIFDNGISVNIWFGNKTAFTEVLNIDGWHVERIGAADALVDYLHELCYKSDTKTCPECDREFTGKPPYPQLCNTCQSFSD